MRAYVGDDAYVRVVTDYKKHRKSKETGPIGFICII